MPKVLGIDKLTNTLDKFLEEFECTSIVDTDFYCLNASNIIAVALVVAEKHSSTFMSRVKKLYPDIHADEFLWSFLHEVGHIETLDLLDDDEIIYSELQKKNENITDEVYYELPDEFAATDWAANYMRNNTEKVAKFWSEVQSAIMNIYQINNVAQERK